MLEMIDIDHKNGIKLKFCCLKAMFVEEGMELES
jgi:hypothetical protein